MNDRLNTLNLARVTDVAPGNAAIQAALTKFKPLSPTVIQSHLKKLFAGIFKVKFSPANDQSIAMCSLAGEEVPFNKPVQVTEQVEA